MKKHLFFLVCLLFVCSCKSVKRLPLQQQTTTTVTDSTATRTEVQDSLLVLRQAETATLTTLLDKLTATPITKTNGAATVTLSRQGNQIQAVANCAQLEYIVQLQKEIIEHYRQTETVTTTEVPVKTKTPWYKKEWLWFVLGCLTVLLGPNILKTVLPIKL